MKSVLRAVILHFFVIKCVVVAETGVLWPWREAEEKTKPISFFLLDHETFYSEFPFIFLK